MFVTSHRRMSQPRKQAAGRPLHRSVLRREYDYNGKSAGAATRPYAGRTARRIDWGRARPRPGPAKACGQRARCTLSRSTNVAVPTTPTKWTSEAPLVSCLGP